MADEPSGIAAAATWQSLDTGVASTFRICAIDPWRSACSCRVPSAKAMNIVPTRGTFPITTEEINAPALAVLTSMTPAHAPTSGSK